MIGHHYFFFIFVVLLLLFFDGIAVSSLVSAFKIGLLWTEHDPLQVWQFSDVSIKALVEICISFMILGTTSFFMETSKRAE